ncbi:MAG TPA: hypothetical protein PLQ11_08805 [Beijerinckiaceae bacterium]|nr:hypothetical protein [Beijerinckiaceae bacterium]
MPFSSSARCIRVTREDLAGVIDDCGACGPLSPRRLMGAAHVARPGATDGLRDAAGVLSNPRSRITLRLWSDEAACAETTILFPGDPATGGGYTLNDHAGECEVCGPVEAHDLLRLIAPLLPPAPAAPPFVLQLDVVAMATLAVLVDETSAVIRSRRVARALDGATLADSALADASPLTTEHLLSALTNWWGLSRFDQLLTYVVALGGRPEAPAAAEVAEAVQRLQAAGLVVVGDGQRLMPAAMLEPLSAAALGLVAGAQWQRAALTGEGVLALDERILLAGTGGTLFEVTLTAAGLVRLARTDRHSVTAYLVGELSGFGKPAPDPVAPVKAAQAPRRFCHQCGKPTGETDRFCAHCGEKLM